MKKITYLFALLLIVSCGSNKKVVQPEPLFKILKSSQEEGATFKFYESITEKTEFSMLLNDPELKSILQPNDILTCNYALINLGAKPDSGYAIDVTLIAETADKIVLKISEIKPKIDSEEGSNPLFILKVNSKKNLEFQ